MSSVFWDRGRSHPHHPVLQIPTQEGALCFLSWTFLPCACCLHTDPGVRKRYLLLMPEPSQYELSLESL